MPGHGLSHDAEADKAHNFSHITTPQEERVSHRGAGPKRIISHMKRALTVAALVVVAAAPMLAGAKGTVTGSYVEARTAEVFTGGCIMNSEAETMGKQAVLAWKVDRGSFNGIVIDGLSGGAGMSGDRHLGMTERGGGKPAGPTPRVVRPRAHPGAPTP